MEYNVVGLLSHWIQKSIPDEQNVDFLLVDRASNRYKVNCASLFEHLDLQMLISYFQNAVSDVVDV